MEHPGIVYKAVEQPKRWLAALGLLGLRVLAAVSHIILLTLLFPIAVCAAFVGFFEVLITGSLSPPIHRLMEIWLRWDARALAWVAGFTDEYPPFEPNPAGYGCDARVPRPEAQNRWWAAAGVVGGRLITAIPHLLALAFASVAAILVAWIGQAAVLLTGSLPAGTRNFLAGTIEWWLRTASWLLGVTDRYPPFTAWAPPAPH